MSVAARQQPVERAHVEHQYVGISVGISVGDALAGAAIAGDLDPHHVPVGIQGHANGSAAGTHTARRRQRHAQRMYQRAGISANRLHVVTGHHGARHIPVLGMMLEQCQRGTHTVAGHHGFGSGITTPRQLSQLLQQSVQTVGIGAQSGEHAFVGKTRRIEQRSDSRNRRHAIAERMCQPTQQIVMYQEPSRRARVAAHV